MIMCETNKKVCNKCGDEKPLTKEYFYANKLNKDGFCIYCKDCKREFDKKYRQENEELIKERKKKYYEKNKQDRVHPEKSKEECRKIALKYNTIKELKLNDSYVYGRIHNKGWNNELLTHMKRLGSLYCKGVYKYTFPDGAVYYGITQHFKTRHGQHMGKFKNRRTTVTKYMEKTGLIPQYLQLTNYIKSEIAVKIEEGLVVNDREMGIKVLNKVKTGGIGRQKKISDEKILNSMRGYEYVHEWRKENKNYYLVAKNRNRFDNNYLTSLYKKGGLKKRPTNLKWDFDTIKKYIEENNIESRSGKNGLYRKNQTSYNYARKQGWLDALFPVKYKNQFI